VGAENRNHPPRLHPREMLLPCRHAASLHPRVGDRPLLLDVQPVWPQAKRGRGMVVTLSYGFGPSEAQLRQLGGLGWGWGWAEGEKIPEPGKADTLLEEGRKTRPPQSNWRWGVSTIPRERTTCVWVPRGPRGQTRPISTASAIPPFL